MKNTINYKMKKPDGEDCVDINDLNYNFDIIDKELKDIKSNSNSIMDATIAQKGIVKLNNAINSTSQTEAATPLAVKTAMDKANEAFQYASNGKNLIAGKIGNVTGNNTHAEIANRIQADKNTMANNLNNKGVSANENETLASLIDKIAQVNIEGMGGMKYASGIYFYTGNSQFTINLNFTPNLVIMFNEIREADELQILGIAQSFSNIFPKDFKIKYRYPNNSGSLEEDCYKNHDGIVINNNSFTHVNCLQRSQENIHWYAFKL